MIKKEYLKPTMEVVLVQQTQMLCSSTVINPGGPNMPAGAPEFGDWNVWDNDGLDGND